IRAPNVLVHLGTAAFSRGLVQSGLRFASSLQREATYLRGIPNLSINSYRLGRLISSSAAARVKFPLLRARAASTICRSTALRASLRPCLSWLVYGERLRSFGATQLFSVIIAACWIRFSSSRTF